MPKKRVGVSLRKPSPAPDGVPPSAQSPIAPSVDAAGAHGSAAVALDLQPDTLRRESTPPLPPEPVVVEAFVNGAAAALESAASSLPAAKLQNLLRRGAEGYRELTLYLPEKLAQELSLHCLEHNLDMNRLVAQAVERLLERELPARQRRTSDAPTNDGLLSVAARALLTELGEWVRQMWAQRRRALGRVSAPFAAH
jgi:hypothetical protein